jgi:hypothetical protein
MSLSVSKLSVIYRTEHALIQNPTESFSRRFTVFGILNGAADQVPRQQREGD